MKILLKSFKSFKRKNGAQWSAALAYYSIFAFPLIIILILLIIGLFADDQLIAQNLLQNISTVAGEKSAELFKKIIESKQSSANSIWKLVLNLGIIFIGATAITKQLQKCFNEIYDIKIKPATGLKVLLLKRLEGALLILIIGLLLLASAVTSSVINYIGVNWLNWKPLIQTTDYITSWILMSLFFASLFKFLPDAKMKWKSVLIPATVSGLLFLISKYLLTWYFSYFAIGSSFGAIGSLVVLILWTYYVFFILIFGGHLSKTYSDQKNYQIEPNNYATKN